MLSYVSGNLFEAPVQTLVNTVNTVGVMGKGIALTFKQIYPEMFREYRELCESGRLKIGGLHIYRTAHKVVLNFPTKEHWRNPSKLEYIEAGLRAFVRIYERAGIHSVAFPPLGCGNGELDFGVVGPLMERYLAPLNIPVLIYAPLPKRHVAEHHRQEEIAEWLRSSPSDLPFDEVWLDIVRMVTEKRVLETLSRGGSFEAELADGRDGLRLRMSGRRTTVVRREEFAEVWTQLRDFGILTAAQLPARTAKVAAYVMPIFAALPYVQIVPISPNYNHLSKATSALGLQVIPAVRATEQRELALL